MTRFTASPIRTRLRKGFYVLRAGDGEILPANFTKEEADMILDAMNGRNNLAAFRQWVAGHSSFMLRECLQRHLDALEV